MRRLTSFVALAALVLGLAVVVPGSPAGAATLGTPVFGTRTVTTAVHGGDGTGGSPQPAVRCPAGSVVTTLVGLQQEEASYFMGIGIDCAPITSDPSGAAALGEASYAGDYRGANNVGVPQDSACPAGSVLAGFNGIGGFVVDALQAICAPLNADGTLGAADQYAEPIGAPEFSGDTEFPDALCPTGSIVTGIVGRAGDSLDSVSLECQSLTFQQPLPSNTSWPTATTLGTNDSIDDTLGISGEQLWYRVPVTPGSRVQVDLSNLPANYDLAVFKDIGQAFNSLTSTADLTKLSAEFAGDAFAPSVFTPSVFTPSVFTPSVFTPSVFTPSVFTPSVFTPSVFTPSVFTPSVFTPSVFTPSVFTPANFSPSVFTPSVFTPSSLPDGLTAGKIADAFSSAQTRSLLGVSAVDGTAPESINLATWNNTGYFYIRVTGRNGAFSPNAFHLAVTTTGGACSGVNLDPHQNDTTITGTPGPQTLILTDPTRLPGTDAAKATLATDLNSLAQATNGVVVNLADSPKIVALNQQADAATSCPFAKNLVAQAIRDVVNSYRGSNLKYVVLVGGDHAIPFFRYPDAAGLGPESNYSPPVLDSSASQASLRSNDVLGQDAYGAASDLSVKGSTLPIPDLAVGRLVETPSEISANVERYLAANGAPIVPQSTLVTGYDFLTDAADGVEADLAAGTPDGTHDTLITDSSVPPSTTTVNGTPDRQHSWTATDLANVLLTKRHDITFLAGHFSANSALAADYSTSLLTTQLASAPAGNFANTLVFSAGCHSGYNIVDTDGVPDVTVGLDWAQAFAQQGATLVAGTGYQYGDTDFVKYGEKLYGDFAHDLRYGTGSVAVGDALVEAKSDYLSGLTSVTGIDQKTLLESTLFGLPMQGVDLPGGRIDRTTDDSVVTPTGATDDPGHTLGLRVADYDVTPNLQTHTQDLASSAGGTVTATYLSGPDGVVNNPGEPTIPLISANVTDPGNAVLRGVGFRSGTYTDTDGITPLVGVATTEQSGAHSPFTSSTFFPNRIATPNYFGALTSAGDGTTRLSVTPVQHRTDSSGTGTDTQRVYNNLGFQLFYSANTTSYDTGQGTSNQPGLAAPPSITGITSYLVGNDLHVEARVVGDPSAGIQNVWVTYTGEGSSTFHGTWASLDLSQDQNDSTLWTGVIPVTDGDTADVRFLVQAVNGVGLVGIDDNQGAYYAPAVVPSIVQDTQATTNLALGSVSPSVAYGSMTPVTATLTDPTGTGIPDAPVTFTLGGSTVTAQTDGTGVASANLPVSVVPGSYPVSAAFAGDSVNGPSSTSGGPSVQVTKAPTTITVAAGATPDVAATATLSSGGQALRQSPVFFAVSNANTGSLVGVVPTFTDGTGVAQLPASALPTGAVTVVAYFGSATTPLPSGGTLDQSDPDYAAAVSTPALRIPTQSTTKLKVGSVASSVAYHGSLAVSAVLTSSGSALKGRTVTFQLGTAQVSATTGTGGKASAHLPVTVDPGVYRLTASFAGENTYAGVTGNGAKVKVVKAITSLSIAAGTNPQQAARATLTSGGTGVRGKSVVFVIRDPRTNRVLADRTVMTDRLGRAVLPSADVAPRGNTSVQAYFGSSATPLPGGHVANLADVDYASSATSTLLLATTTHFLNTAVIGRHYSSTVPIPSSATASATGLPSGLSLTHSSSGWAVTGTAPAKAGWDTVAITWRTGSGSPTTTWYVIVVDYAFTPFAAPVNDPAGSSPSVFPVSSAVPLRFRLVNAAGTPIPAADAAAIAHDGRATITIVQVGTTSARANEVRVAPVTQTGTTFAYDGAHNQFVYTANPASYHWIAGDTYRITVSVRTAPGRLVGTHSVVVGFAR